MAQELLGLTLEELRHLAQNWGEPSYRGDQLFHALYAERCWDFAAMTSLPLNFRRHLQRAASVTVPTVERKWVSKDGTIRYVFRLADGKTIETVWMPEGPTSLGDTETPGPTARRQTICVSSQAGCPVDCHFCATAQLGLIRNLSAGEIVGQVLAAFEENRAALRPVTNVVFMGQGEPLLNYEASLKAVRLLADPGGMNIPLRRLTLSTSGIVPGIHRLGKEELRPKLAVSLNATTDEVRTVLMPINKKYPLPELLAACRDYPLRPGEHLTFEYVLLRGVNDSAADARRLVEHLTGLRAKVNLIPWNPAPGLSYEAPKQRRIAEFQKLLRNSGLLAFIRRSQGQDVFAACGQLSLLEASPEPPALSLP